MSQEKEKNKVKYSEVITINAGGRIFTTTVGTVTRSRYFITVLGLTGRSPQPKVDGHYFVDCDGDIFGIMLEVLRTGHVPNVKEFERKYDAQYINYLFEKYSIPWINMKEQTDNVNNSIQNLIIEEFNKHKVINSVANLIKDELNKQVIDFFKNSKLKSVPVEFLRLNEESNYPNGFVINSFNYESIEVYIEEKIWKDYSLEAKLFSKDKSHTMIPNFFDQANSNFVDGALIISIISPSRKSWNVLFTPFMTEDNE